MKMIENREGYKKTKFGWILNDWDVISFGNFMNIKAGFGYKKKEYTKEGLKLLKIDNVSYGRIIWDNISYLPENYRYKYPELILNEGDILIALNRPITQDKLKIGIIEKRDIPSILYQRVGKIIFLDNSIDRTFIYHLLTKEIKEFVETNSVGSDQPFINVSEIRKMKLSIPPLPEQKKIAEILSTWEHAIEKTEALIKEKENLKKGLMQQLLTGKVRFREFLEKEEFKDTKIGRIPEDWEILKIKDYVTKSKDKIDPKVVNEDLRCIELEHIDQETGILKGWTNIKQQSSIKNGFNKSNVLFGKLRPYLKKYWYATFNGACSSEIWVLQTKDNYYKKYLYYLVQTQRFIRICNMTSGTKMPRSDWNLVSLFEVVIPSIPEQKEITLTLSNLDDEIEKIHNQRKFLKEQKKGLMQQLLTGKTRVKIEET